MELILIILATVVLWAPIRIYSKSKVELIETWATEEAVDNQERLKELDERIDATIEANSKWFTLKSINQKMK